MPVSSNTEKLQLAFLGPLGTYSHQAALEYFGDSVQYLAQPTIGDVQRTLSTTVPLGIIPQENSINGTVTEAYNVLRSPAIGQETFVRGTTVIEVKHSLVVRRDVKLQDIGTVLSHEQALGQCQNWLAEHLPRASLVHTDSTANATRKLLLGENGLDPMKSAAICSSVVATLYGGLEVLVENIQDRTENLTRFYILSQGLDVALPKGYLASAESMALLRFQAPPGDPVESALDIPRVISTLEMIVKRIDRRPSIQGRPFDNVYFLEVGAILGRNNSELSWIKQLQRAVDRVKSMGVEASILGYW